MSMVLGSGLGVVDHLAHSCCDSKDLRGLSPGNIPSFGFCGMRSSSYMSEVTNGKLVDSSAELKLGNTGNKICQNS